MLHKHTFSPPGDLNAGHGSPAVDKLSAALSECSSQCCEAVLPGMLGKCATFVGFDKSIDSQVGFCHVTHLCCACVHTRGLSAS